MEKRGKDKALKNWVILAVICCLLILIVGFVGTYKVKQYRASAEAETKVWQECVEKDTYTEYAKYIVSYPQGLHSKDALARMDELKNENTEQQNKQ